MLASNERAAAMRTLEGFVQRDGSMPNRAVAQVARQFGVSTRTIRRHWASHLEAVAALDTDVEVAVRPRPWWDDARVLQVLAASATTKAAWSALRADADVQVPGYPSFTRTLKQKLDSAVYASLTSRGAAAGRVAYVKHSLYLRCDAERRNQVWQADAQQIPVDTVSDRGGMRFKPWQTTFIDDATRMVMATVITPGPPRANDVLAALASGIRQAVLPDGVLVGGLPAAIRFDNGREFVNEALQAACARLGIQAQLCAPYSPWQKGKIERWHETIQSELFDTLPGATHGPRSFTGTQYWRGVDEDVLDLRTLIEETLAWIETYNYERAHTALGCTPAAAWSRDATELTWAPAELIHQFSLAVPKLRTVNSEGVSVGGIKYLAPEMAPLVRRKVEVRVLPHDPSVIAIFHDDKFVCEARPATNLSREELLQILTHRKETYRQIRDLHSAGAQRRFQAARIAQEDAELDLMLADHDNHSAPAGDSDDAGVVDGREALLELVRDEETP